MATSTLAAGLALLLAPLSAATKLADCYRIDDLKLPEGCPPEVGAIDFADDGTLFVVLRRGDVFRAEPTADPAAFEWRLFATGFHNGCGIDVVSPTKVRVTQMAEMTEAEDIDGDGLADRYARFAAGWGLSGNYHETNTLTGDGKGGYFLAIGTASHNGPVFGHTLGAYSRAGHRGRNFAAVKWKGWVLHCGPDGRLEPFASGFRMHNGIYRDPDGRLWCGDNQGDWKAITPLYHVEKGNFYGHPSSRVWDPDFTRSDDPLGYYVQHLDDYNADRTRAAVLIPHGEMNRSAGEPMEIPRDGSFGPFAGQMILPDNNGTRITRIGLEEVDGVMQGFCTHFLNGRGLRSGNHRVRFRGKQLYVGQTVRGWGTPAEGLQRITWLGGTPYDIDRIRITPGGFRVSFTAPLPDALLDAGKWKLSSCVYQPRWTYGSDPEDRKDHRPAVTRVDERTVALDFDGLARHRVYRIELPKHDAADGSPLQNSVAYYTVNAVPE